MDVQKYLWKAQAITLAMETLVGLYVIGITVLLTHHCWSSFTTSFPLATITEWQRSALVLRVLLPKPVRTQEHCLEISESTKISKSTKKKTMLVKPNLTICDV